MLYSAKHNLVIIQTDEPLKLASAVEGAKRINGEHVAFPPTFGNLQAARRIGYQVLPPMELDGYDWPIKRPWLPLPHQKTTANFLCLHPRSFCFNDMGTMKTLSSLWAADYLMEMHRRKGEKFRALVVAPLSILKVVWARAIFDHFLGRRKCVILHGAATKRRKLLEQDVDFYIINHDGLAVGYPSDRTRPIEGLAKDLRERNDIRLAIVDEAGAYRGHTTRRSRAARAIIGPREYLWLLTGTPTPNGPVDAYGLAKLVNNANGESYSAYKNRVMMQVAQWKWVPRVGSAKAASDLLQPAVRFNSDFLDLPPCTPEQREVPLSKEQAQALKTLKQEAVLALKSGALVHAVNEAALRLKLIQVACGEVYDEHHVAHNLNPEPRLAELEAIIEETDRKVVVFAPLTSVLNMLSTKLKKWESCVVNGQVPLAERGRLFRRFGDKEDKLRVCFADPGAVAHGVNDLVTASVVVWYGPTDKGELYFQGNKRVDRPGQIGPTKIIQLVSTETEREIYKRLEGNQTMQGVILKLAEEP